MSNILELNQINKTYGNKKALSNITLDIAPGRIVGLLGSNGSGKSTLMKLVAGLLHPAAERFKSQVSLLGWRRRHWFRSCRIVH